MKIIAEFEKKLDDFCLSVSFSVDSEVFSLLGASGSGKSMTLKCIAGIEKPDRGRIILGDRILYDSEKKINLPARKRKVGYLFQDYALFPKMTVLENIMISGCSRAEAEKYVENFKLSERKNARPDELSGGQKQRVAIARMLAMKPEIILLDEPYSALDNYLRSMMERELLSMLEKYDGPVIFVSHDRNEVYRISDKIAVLDNGRMLDVRPKNDFFANPGSVCGTRLTGCKNISEIEQINGRYFAKDWGINVSMPAETDVSKIRYIGYRAHYFKKEDRMSDSNVFDCKIERIIEDTFSVIILFRQKDITCGDPLYWEISKEEAKMLNPQNGMSLYLRLLPEKMILLEK